MYFYFEVRKRIIGQSEEFIQALAWAIKILQNLENDELLKLAANAEWCLGLEDMLKEYRDAIKGVVK
jgi:hypothetical protein